MCQQGSWGAFPLAICFLVLPLGLHKVTGLGRCWRSSKGTTWSLKIKTTCRGRERERQKGFSLFKKKNCVKKWVLKNASLQWAIGLRQSLDHGRNRCEWQKNIYTRSRSSISSPVQSESVFSSADDVGCFHFCSVSTGGPWTSACVSTADAGLEFLTPYVRGQTRESPARLLTLMLQDSGPQWEGGTTALWQQAHSVVTLWWNVREPSDETMRNQWSVQGLGCSFMGDDLPNMDKDLGSIPSTTKNK